WSSGSMVDALGSEYRHIFERDHENSPDRRYLASWKLVVHRRQRLQVGNHGAEVGVAQSKVLSRRHDEQRLAVGAHAMADGANPVRVRVTQTHTAHAASEIRGDKAADHRIIEKHAA